MDTRNWNDEHFTAIQKEELKEIVVAVVRRNISDLETAVANLRLEVDGLRQELRQKSDWIDAMEPLLRQYLINDIQLRLLKKKEVAEEAAYKKFFCDDMGFLYVIADLLSEMSEMKRTDSVSAGEIRRFYCKNFYPLQNNLIVLKNALKRTEEVEDCSSFSVEKLKTVQMQLNQERLGGEEDTPGFYTQLWEGIKPVVSVICQQNFEESLDGEEACQSLLSTILHLRTSLEENGIQIVDGPSAATADFFKQTATADISSRPLVRKADTAFVYTYGLINPAKPFCL